MPKLFPGIKALAIQLNEALFNSDVVARLSDAIRELKVQNSDWYGCYYVNHIGDDAAGKVVYYMNGDLTQAPYTIVSAADGKSKTTIDTAMAVDVVPVVTYVEELDEMALEAKRAKESKNVSRGTSGKLALVESAGGFLDTIQVREARTNYPIKIISPGTGSTAHYPAAVLERDGPKIFKTGTLMFWNHATRAEEASRPEGDLDNLAAIISKDSYYDANGKQGPGLYAEAKVMADYAEKIEARAPHIGLSIRAGGTGTGKMVNGKPELATLDYAESVDYVTKAGRGGLALAEAARDAGILDLQEVSMTKEEIQALLLTETAGLRAEIATLKAETNPLRERAIKGDAAVTAGRILATLAFPEAARQLVIDTVLREAVPMLNGALEETKFTEIVTQESKRVGAVLSNFSGGARVIGMGSYNAPAPVDPAKLREAKALELQESKDLTAQEEAIFGSLMNDPAAAKAAVGKVVH